MAELIFLSSICSGSVVGAVFFKKKFEEIFPLTCMGIIVFLYVAGLLEGLYYGVITLLIILMSSIVVSMVYACYKKTIRECISRFFSPAFFLIFTIFVASIIFDYGRLAIGNDETSHWIDVIKAMDLLDDFATNPMSHSGFPNYPPAVALFQLFYQKIYHIFGDSIFCEWRMFVAYKMLMFSLLTPVLSGLKHRNYIKNFAIIALYLITPALLYPYALDTCLIDPIISYAYGAGFVMQLFYPKKDLAYKLYIPLLCFSLVLTKDVGLFFAVVIIVTQIYIDIRNWRREKKIQLVSLFAIIATVIAKITWNIEVATSGAKVVFGGKIDVLEYTKIVFLQNDNTWKQEAVNHFLRAFYSVGPQINLNFFTITISPLFIICSLTVAFVLLYFFAYRPFRGFNGYRETYSRLPVVFSILIAQALLYIYLLGATYMSNFSKNDFLNLASYLRYVRMSLVPIVMVIVYMVIYFMKNDEVVVNDYKSHKNITSGKFVGRLSEN